MRRELYRGCLIEAAERHDPSDWVVSIDGKVQILAHLSSDKALAYARRQIDKTWGNLEHVA